MSGYISVTTGSASAANATVVTLTFGTAYSTLAKCSLWPANAATTDLVGSANVYVPVPTTTTFNITAQTALAASTLYTWGYTCTQ